MIIKYRGTISPCQQDFYKRVSGKKLSLLDEMFYGKPSIKNWIKLWKKRLNHI